MNKPLLIIGLLCCLAFTACGGSSDEGTARSAEHKAAKWPELEQAALHEGAAEAVVPSGPPPKEVVVNDLDRGNGRVIQKGDWFLISYVAFDYVGRQATEDKRDANSWNWTWGVGELSKGWEIGLRGLREGGIRELFVPSKLAYGTGARVYILKLRKLSNKPEET